MAWEYANTYAPWATPNGQTGYNPSFAGQGQQSEGYSANMHMWLGPDSTASILDPFGWAKQKKRSSPNFYAPSYQGTMFTPEEGLPSWYTDNDPNTSYYSPEGMYANMTQQMMGQPQTQNAPQTSYSGSGGLNSGYDMMMPTQVNQAPWIGSQGNSGAFSNVGGYQLPQENTFVPTGGYGQY